MTTSTRTSTRTRRTPSPSSTAEEALGDPSELPFSHGDRASVVSSVAPSAAGSSSGSKSSTRLLCIECYAPRRMALLRAELYHTLDDLKELSAHLPDADADGAWKYLPSLAAITPDAVSSGSNVVSTAVDRSVGMGMRAPAATFGRSFDSPQRFTDEEERRHHVRWSDASDKSAAGTPRRRSFESSIGDSVGAAVVASDIVVDEAVLFSNSGSKMMTVRPATFVSAPLPQTHIKSSRHVSRLLLSSLLQQTPSRR